MTSEYVSYAEKDSVTTLLLTDEARRNCLSPDLVFGLTEALERAAAAPSVRCVVIAGEGSGFCSGADLTRMRAATPLEDRDEYDDILRLNRLLWGFSKPTIAAVHGFAMGAGANLMSWCDIAIADPQTRIGFPEVQVGVPSATVVPTLLRTVGRKKMYELVLTGSAITAEEAQRIGLVSRLSAPGSAMAEAREMAELISSRSSKALRFTKEIIHAVTDMSYADGILYAREIRVISRLGSDFTVRVDAGTSRAVERSD